MGFLIGGIKSFVCRKPYSQKKVESVHRLLNKAAQVLKYSTFLMLALSFIWCVYFLLLAVLVPERSEYANNMSELIVAVLTVVSILFAFVEFLKRKEK